MGPIVEASEYQGKKDPGPFSVAVLTGSWTDADREGREVPWKIYYPEDTGGPVPLVISSHGGGGSRDGSEYLGRHLASHGIAACHIQHRGTDIDAIRDNRQGLLQVVRDPVATTNRFKDIPFTVDQLDAMAESGAMSGRLDTSRVGMSGHSLGCVTTLIAAGLRLPAPVDRSLAVPRFRAAIAMSPAPPQPGWATPDAFDEMSIPIFHLTGTGDESPLANFPPEARQLPFRQIDTVDQYLVVFKDGNHMTFTDRPQVFGQDFSYPSRDRHHELIKMAAVAFWESYLEDDQDARNWFAGGGFGHELGEEGTFEFKPARD